MVRPRGCGAPVGDSIPDCDDGHPCGGTDRTVPVPAQLERFGRVGQWRVPGRRLVGLMSGYAMRVTQPPPSGRPRVRSDRTPELGPVARATGRSGFRLGMLPFSGLSGRLVQSKLPGRKFQSHPGVPPARIIGHLSYIWEFAPGGKIG